MIFLDTSVLVKRYQEEAGSAMTRDLFAGETIVLAPIAPVELQAALGRRLRERGLDPAKADVVFREIQRDWPAYLVAPFDQELVDEAVALVRAHPLKSLDAIQLASARLARPSSFITADRALHAAATRVLPCPCRLLAA